MNIVTRQESLAIGTNRYFTGKPCKHGHVCERSTVDKKCMECLRLRSADWRRKNQKPDGRKKPLSEEHRRKISAWLSEKYAATRAIIRQAIAAGEKTYFTGEACKNGHIAARNISNRTCNECCRVNGKDDYIKHKEDPVRREQRVIQSRRDQMGIYGLTLEDYDRLYDAQDGKCAICESPSGGFKLSPFAGLRLYESPKLAVDHCHETGTVLGLLCIPCNAGSGSFKDNPHLMQRGAFYRCRDALELYEFVSETARQYARLSLRWESDWVTRKCDAGFSGKNNLEYLMMLGSAPPDQVQ